MRSALRIVSSFFRTVSMDAALVIAGMMPLQMLIEVERRKHLTSTRTGLMLMHQVNADFHKGKIDLQNNTKYSSKDWKETWPGKILCYTTLKGPRML